MYKKRILFKRNNKLGEFQLAGERKQ